MNYFHNLYSLQYTADKKGEPGKGGEYHVQVGFGWTNGVILELLDRYQKNLTFIEKSTSNFGSELKPHRPKTTWTFYLGIVAMAVGTIFIFCIIFRRAVQHKRLVRYRLDDLNAGRSLLQEEQGAIR